MTRRPLIRFRQRGPSATHTVHAAGAALILSIGLLATGFAQPALARAAGLAKTMKAIDSDNDGTIDLAEVHIAAKSTFGRLDKDKDGSVDTKELQGRLSRKELKAADPDGDGTVDEKEYAALVEQRFKAADPDGDGTLDAKELKSASGRALLQLLH